MSETHVDASTHRQDQPSKASAAAVARRDGITAVTATPAVQLDSGRGKTIIHDVVVAKIAAAAAREVDGLHDLVPIGAGAAIAGLTERVMASDQRTTGVHVEVGQREAAVDINVTVDYGVSIPRVAEQVRQSIIERVRAMTGLTVKEVNINTTDLYFAEEQGPSQPRVQ
jgi:uncharacterized alkaline shock family protein YloU